jgi:hypothetical protein
MQALGTFPSERNIEALAMSEAHINPLDHIDPLDRPVYGAKNIAQVLNLVTESGEPKLAITYKILEGGHIDAEKFGTGRMATWWSTARRLLKLPRDAVGNAHQTKPVAVVVDERIARREAEAKAKKTELEAAAKAKAQVKLQAKAARQRKHRADQLRAKAAKLRAEAAALEHVQPEVG